MPHLVHERKECRDNSWCEIRASSGNRDNRSPRPLRDWIRWLGFGRAGPIAKASGGSLQRRVRKSWGLGNGGGPSIARRSRLALLSFFDIGVASNCLQRLEDTKGQSPELIRSASRKPHSHLGKGARGSGGLGLPPIQSACESRRMERPVEQEIAELEENGFVILPEVLTRAEIAGLTEALAPYEAQRPMGRNNFEGEQSKRIYSLAGKGDRFMALAEHPRIVRLLDRLLLPRWLLSTMQSIRLFPGETRQPWHTDDAFYLIPRPRQRLAISVIWAIEPFTAENGATEVFPGSHRWADRAPGLAIGCRAYGGDAGRLGARLRGRALASRGCERLAEHAPLHQPSILPAVAEDAGVPTPDRAAGDREAVLCARALDAGLQHSPALPRPGGGCIHCASIDRTTGTTRQRRPRSRTECWSGPNRRCTCRTPTDSYVPDPGADALPSPK